MPSSQNVHPGGNASGGPVRKYSSGRPATPASARARHSKVDPLRWVLATRFGGKAVEMITQRQFGCMVAWDPPDIITRRLEDVVGKTKTVPLDYDLLKTAKAIGVSFGD